MCAFPTDTKIKLLHALPIYRTTEKKKPQKKTTEVDFFNTKRNTVTECMHE